MTLPGDPPSGNGGPASSRRPPPGGGPIAPPLTIPLVQAVTWAEPQPLRPFEIEPTLTACVTAQLPVLPEPLRPKGSPLLIVIECWSDGTFVAKLPAARLQASGETESAALYALAEDVAEVVLDLTQGAHATSRLGGAMLDTWRALCALIEAPGLDGRDRR